MSTQFATAYKFHVIAFSNKVNDQYENKVDCYIFAKDQQELEKKVKLLIDRALHEIISVTEVLDLYEFEKKVVINP